MHRSRCRPSVAAFVVCAFAMPAVAQFPRLVSPNGFGPVPGANTTGYPFGYANYQSFRYQQIHDDVTGIARVMLGLAIRRKEIGAPYVAFSPTLRIDLSTGGVTSQSATSTYATNHGPNVATVMATTTLNFAATNPPTDALAAPFAYRMPFDQPFVYSGAGSICWEIVMTASTFTAGTTMNFDLVQNGIARNQAYGNGCGGVTLTGSYAAPNLVQTVSGLAPNAPAVLMLGVENLRAFGLPLPLDLGVLGAVGCSLYLEPAAYVTVVGSASGVATLSTNVSQMQPDFVLQFQALAPSAANPLGLSFSNALAAMPVTPRTFMRNWNSNVASATGNLQLIFGLAVEFLQP